MALPGQAGRNFRSMTSGAKRGAFARSPSAAKRGVFGASPSAAKKGVFGFTPGSQKPTSPALGSFNSASGTYTPGGNSFQNFSQQDQQVMFGASGGKDKFIENAISMQEKYPRGLNYQKFLEDAKKYQAGLASGGKEVVGADGILRLNMAGADVPMKDAQGNTILSMQSPMLTANAPTLSQLIGDMARAGGDMLSGIARLPGQAVEMYKQFSPLSFILNQFQGANQSSGSVSEASFKEGLNNSQLAIYNYHRNTGNSPEFARQMALMNRPNAYAMGGVVNL
tara:strand:+ start:1655 stop:2497 length:843 start_codon:yes stop_codon:yes gene_type:complete